MIRKHHYVTFLTILNETEERPKTVPNHRTTPLKIVCRVPQGHVTDPHSPHTHLYINNVTN